MIGILTVNQTIQNAMLEYDILHFLVVQYEQARTTTAR